MNKLITIFLVAFFGLATTLTAQTVLSDQDFVNNQITGAGIYLLEEGKVYFFDGILTISEDVTIQGPDVDWIRNASSPPVLVNIPDDAGAAQRFMDLAAGGSLTLKNMIISGRASNDAISGDIVLSLDDGGDAFTADNVAFVDYTGRAFYNRGNDIVINMTNNFFINAQDLAYGPWGGDPIRIQGKPGPTLLENNTVVNHSRLTGNAGPGRTIFHQLHNTTVNGMKMSQEPRAFEAIMANNLHYNYDFLGSKNNAIVYERYMFSWMYFADYEGKLDSLSGYTGQNAFFKEQEILDWFATEGGDSITDVYTQEGELFASPDANRLYTADAGDFKLGTNYYGFDPQFNTHPGNTAEVVELINDFWYEDRRGEWPDWRVESPVTYQDEGATVVLSWPPAFDLTYSNQYLQTAGTDGLPVGDLNWFPADKATYEANRDMYVAALKDSILNATAIYADTSAPTPLITPEDVNAIEELDLATPNKFALGANYPNPFNPSTTLKFSLAKTANVSLKIYDLTGKLAMTVFDDNQTAGAYSVSIDMANFSSGVYFAVLNNGSQKLTRKMMLIK